MKCLSDFFVVPQLDVDPVARKCVQTPRRSCASCSTVVVLLQYWAQSFDP